MTCSQKPKVVKVPVLPLQAPGRLLLITLGFKCLLISGFKDIIYCSALQ